MSSRCRRFARSVALAPLLPVLLLPGAGAALAQDAPYEASAASTVDSLRTEIDAERLEQLRREAANRNDAGHWYDLGSALLIHGDVDGAVEPLQRAASAASSDVDESAVYNLGLAGAISGQPGGPVIAGGGSASDARRERLMQARDAFRRVLRADPGAEDARWNLEVVGRWLQQMGGGGGGGGGGDGGGEGGAGEMSPAEADRLLDAAAAAERRVQQQRLQRNRSRDPVAERNW